MMTNKIKVLVHDVSKFPTMDRLRTPFVALAKPLNYPNMTIYMVDGDFIPTVGGRFNMSGNTIAMYQDEVTPL